MTYRNNIEKLRNRATSVIREGKSQHELAKVRTAEYGWMPYAERRMGTNRIWTR